MTRDIEIDLETIIAAKRRLLSNRQEKMPFQAVVALAEMQKRARTVLNVATRSDEVALIGQIRYESSYDPVAAALRYNRNGLDATALFTDERVYTKGMNDLLLVSRGVRYTPVICQDYILNEYHVTEARAAGASALVAYSSVLDRPDLRRVVSLALRWHMSTIVQVSDETEMTFASGLSPHVIAVGEDHEFVAARDLPLLEQLRPYLPYNTKLMPLGCIRNLQDANAAIALGAEALIVDDTLTPSELDSLRK